MDNSVCGVFCCEAFASNVPSRLEAYGFIIAIILGSSGLIVGGVGAAGYFHVGALSNVSQIDAIIMMGAGGGGGVILFIVGIVGTVKNYQSVKSKPGGGIDVAQENSVTNTISSVDTKEESVYGPEVWPKLGNQIWKCEIQVLDKNIPEAPKNRTEDKIYIYIPQNISVNGQKKECTFDTLNDLDKMKFTMLHKSVREQFGNKTASGWIEVDKNVTPNEQLEDYEAQGERLKKGGFRMPTILEAFVSNLMVFAFTNVRLCEKFIYCSERLKDGDMVVFCHSEYGFVLVASSRGPDPDADRNPGSSREPNSLAVRNVKI